MCLFTLKRDKVCVSIVHAVAQCMRGQQLAKLTASGIYLYRFQIFQTCSTSIDYQQLEIPCIIHNTCSIYKYPHVFTACVYMDFADSLMQVHSCRSVPVDTMIPAQFRAESGTAPTQLPSTNVFNQKRVLQWQLHAVFSLI